MATVLEGCNTEEQCSAVCGFYGQKSTMQRILIKNFFLFYGGKCLSHKAVHNWMEKFLQGPSKVTDDARPRAEVAETTITILLCCEFRRTGKAIGQVYRC
jgi:hypothetical protein